MCILVLDAPTIRLVGEPQIDLEEGKDSLVLRCEADANPPASIVWRRSGRSEIASLQVISFLSLNEFCYRQIYLTYDRCTELNLLISLLILTLFKFSVTGKPSNSSSQSTRCWSIYMSSTKFCRNI